MRLDFGLDCPIGKTQARTLILRNNTAIPTPVGRLLFTWRDNMAPLCGAACATSGSLGMSAVSGEHLG